LGAILLAQFDVFLPTSRTNDLDFDGSRVSESFLDSLPGAAMSCRTPRLLERTITSVLELDAQTSTEVACLPAAGSRT